MSKGTWRQYVDETVSPRSRAESLKYCEEMSEALLDLEAVRTRFNGADCASLVRNVAQSLANSLFAPGVPAEMQVRVVDGLPEFILAAHRQDGSSDEQIYMFWDGIIPRSLGRIAPDALDAVFAALAAQAMMAPAAVQAGALHGISHLRDPRAVAIAARVQRLSIDPDLRKLAAAAMTFSLL